MYIYQSKTDIAMGHNSAVKFISDIAKPIPQTGLVLRIAIAATPTNSFSDPDPDVSGFFRRSGSEF